MTNQVIKNALNELFLDSEINLKACTRPILQQVYDTAYADGLSAGAASVNADLEYDKGYYSGLLDGWNLGVDKDKKTFHEILNSLEGQIREQRSEGIAITATPESIGLDEAIERIIDVTFKKWKCGESLKDTSIVSEFKAILQAYRASQKPQWRNFTEKPNEGEYILAYRPLAGNSGDLIIDVKKGSSVNNHCWPDTVPCGLKPMNYTHGSCHATHWMPLPLPPASEGGDSNG